MWCQCLGIHGWWAFYPVVSEWFPEIDYENVDQRIPLPKGVASGRDWGSTVVTMAKFQDAEHF